jgi:hypothetical protein
VYGKNVISQPNNMALCTAAGFESAKYPQSSKVSSIHDKKQCYATPKNMPLQMHAETNSERIIMLENAAFLPPIEPKMSKLPGVSCSDVRTSIDTEMR